MTVVRGLGRAFLYLSIYLRVNMTQTDRQTDRQFGRKTPQQAWPTPRNRTPSSRAQLDTRQLVRGGTNATDPLTPLARSPLCDVAPGGLTRSHHMS
eukprot:scaffold45999_cov63-Phaeocystis_antarctica.AAC.2